jgi:hypothetical protein
MISEMVIQDFYLFFVKVFGLMKNKTPSKAGKLPELIFLFASVLLIFLLWDTIFVFPIKLFVVFVHELSHASVAILSGGRVKEMEIGFNLGGKIVSEGGSEIAIASAGYLGSLIWGIILIIAAEKPASGRYIIFGLPIFIFLILVQSSPSSTVIILSLIVILTLIFFAFYLRYRIISLLLKVIALGSSLYVMVDIKEDLFTNNLNSDALILSQLTGINSTLIGFAWMTISIILLGLITKIFYSRKKG